MANRRRSRTTRRRRTTPRSKRRRRSRLEMSNDAHRRLARKHATKASTDVTSWIKCGYHNQVLSRQEKDKKILSADEKSKIYRNNEYYAYN